MFGNPSRPSRIYTYKARAPIASLETVEDQIRLAHRYRNALIETEHRRHARVEEATRRHAPAYVAAATEMETLAAEKLVLKAEIKRRNQEARRRTATPADRAAMKAIDDRIREVRAALKEARRDAYGDPKLREECNATPPDAPGHAELRRAAYGIAALRTDLDAIDEETEATRRSLRAASGLYWGTYLVAERAFQDSLRPRTGKKPGPPRFRRRTGEGTLAVQLQKGLPVADLLACRDERARLEILPPGPQADPESRRSREKRHAIAWIRVGTADDGRRKLAPVWAKVPVRLHRPLPPDAAVQWIHLQRTRIGHRTWWEVQFVLAQDRWDRPDRAADGTAGLELGWRLVPDGLRVALAVGGDGWERELVIPHDEISAWDKVKSLRSILDREFDAARERLACWINQREAAGTLPDWLKEKVKHLRAWRSGSRLGELVRAWRDRRFEGDEEIFAALEAWRKHDRHLIDWVESQRVQSRRRRDDLYRKFAADLARRYHTVRVEAIDWRKLMEKPVAEATPEEAAVHAAARHHHRIAAVGRLLRFVTEAVAVAVPLPARNTTRRCHACGQTDRFDAGAAIHHTCSRCGATWDQDRNAALNLLQGDTTGAPGDDTPEEETSRQEAA